MATDINDSILNFSPKPLDDKYCRFENGSARPYHTLQEVLTTISVPYRYQGLTVLLNDGEAVKEYWFYGGVSDEHLVVKNKGLALVASTGSYADLLDLPVIPDAQVNADWEAESGIAALLHKPTSLSAFTNDPGYLNEIIAQQGLYGAAHTISLGQEIGQAGDPAALTGSREIPLNGNSFQFSDSGTGSVLLFSSGSLRMQTPSSWDYPYSVEFNSAGRASLTISDGSPDSGSPLINLSSLSGYATIVKEGLLNDRLTITSAYTNNESIPRANFYMYPGSDVFGDDGTPLARVYIGGNFEPNDPLPFSSGQLFKDFYQQSLVVTNAADANGNRYTTGSQQQGSFAAVAPTWNTTASPTLILGNVHHYVSSGSDAKLIDLQVSGVSRFSVYANSGNTVIGSHDNGHFLQVQQPMITESGSQSALHINADWNTTNAVTLIDANVNDLASSAMSNLLRLSVNELALFSFRKTSELQIYTPDAVSFLTLAPRAMLGEGITNQRYVSLDIYNDFEPESGSGAFTEISVATYVRLNGGSYDYTVFDIWPNISQTGATGVVRGIYYRPSVSNIAYKHIALETTEGDVYFSSLGGQYTGRMGVHGVTNPSAWLHMGRGFDTPGTAPMKMTPGALLTTPEMGAFEYDFTHGLYFTPYSTRTSIPLVLFTQVTPVTVSNSTAETSLFNDSVALGSRTLGAAYLTTGRTVNIKIQGHRSAIGSPTFTIKVKFGSTVLLTSAAIPCSVGTNGYFEVEVRVTCITWGTNATLRAQGHVAEGNGPVSRYPLVNSAPITLNTQVSQLVEVTLQWSVADLANSVVVTHAMMEVKN
jgi:hypothetical protein